MRAMLNMIYPGTPLSITEWNAAFAGESDFSTALADADAFGIFGRERVRVCSPLDGSRFHGVPRIRSLKLYPELRRQPQRVWRQPPFPPRTTPTRIFSACTPRFRLRKIR